MASQPSEKPGNPNSAEPPPEVRIDLCSKDMATDQARQGSRKTTREMHEEGSSEGMTTALFEDVNWWAERINVMSDSPVMPKAVVNEEHRSLFEATAKGDWREIERVLNGNCAAMTAKVMTSENDHVTVLEAAIVAGRDHLVEKLAKHFLPNCENLDLGRAVRYAALGGRIRIVKALVDKVDAESTIIDEAFNIAVDRAPNQKEVIWHLARRLKHAPTTTGPVISLSMTGHFDICLYLARKYPGDQTGGLAFLGPLAALNQHFRSGAGLNFWEKCIYNVIPLCLVDTSFDDSMNTKMARALNKLKTSLWNLAPTPAFIKRSGELKFRHSCALKFAELALTTEKKTMDTINVLSTLLTFRIVLDAASHGVYEIVDLCLKHFPELVWDLNFTRELIKEIVKGRHIELFRLVNSHDPIRFLAGADVEANIGLMEAVTKWSPRCVSPDVSGAAFLLQRELQWFQVVEVSNFPSFKWLKYDVQRKTYWEVFVEERKQLHKEAEKWTKSTSSSCSVVATLIITVTFAAAFTVPGGSHSDTGIPIFLKNGSFMVFVVADALALFSSVTATLIFLVILTSRYAMEDFLKSLPRKMILGLTFLFLSLAFMLLAFGSALMIVLGERWKFLYIPLTLLAAFPIVLFAILQLPLYIEMVGSTCRPRLYRPPKLRK